MKFLLFCLILTMLHAEIFSITNIRYENHGKCCKRKPADFCGYNCECAKTGKCKCAKPKSGDILQPCYDNPPLVNFANVTCRRMKDRNEVFMQCKLKCFEDLIQYGYDTLYCRIKGLWDVKKLPKCYTPFGDCYRLKEGGEYEGLKIDKCVTGMYYNRERQEECSFHCENGFEPASTKIKCDFKNSSWVTPNGSTDLFKCEETYNCKPIPKVPGRKQECRKLSAEKPWNCKFSCENDYTVKGGRNKINCNKQGQWEGEPLVCESNYNCKPILKVPGRRQKCQTVSPGKPWNCTFSCENGYSNKEGLDKVSCSKKGQWQGKPLVCEPNYNCKPIPKVPGREQKCKNVTLGKPWNCKLSCEKGYIKKEGIEQLDCNKNSQWTGKPLVCQKQTLGKCKQMTEGNEYEGLKIVKCVLDSQHGHKWQSECTVHCTCDSALSSKIKCDFLKQKWVSLNGTELPKCEGP